MTLLRWPDGHSSGGTRRRRASGSHRRARAEPRAAERDREHGAEPALPRRRRPAACVTAATNIAFERTLGYDPDGTGGVLFWERYVPPEDADAVRAAIAEVARGPHARRASTTARWLRSDGSRYPTWRGRARRCRRSRAARSSSISGHDITERKRQEEELRALARAARRGRRTRRARGSSATCTTARSSGSSRSRSRCSSRRRGRGDRGRRELLDPARARSSRRRSRSCASWPAASTRRCSPTRASAPHSRRSPPARRCRSSSTSRRTERLPEPVEAAAYYFVAEALTNVAKYAQAPRAPRHASRR